MLPARAGVIRRPSSSKRTPVCAPRVSGGVPILEALLAQAQMWSPLYKADLTIPLVFSLHNSPDPEAAARRSFRDGLRLFKLLPRIVTDIQTLLAPGHPADIPDPEEQLVDLWDPITGTVPGGTNHTPDP